jgi:CTP:phosphocholine cytidylyltransferase-like protein
MQATRNISPAKRTVPSEISVIIPCAGISNKKMKNYGPKCLVDINGTTLIERQVNAVWRVFPRADIFVGIGYQAEKIRATLKGYPVRFVYNPLFDTTNVAFTISLALHASVSENAMIIYGDLVFTDEVLINLASGRSSLGYCTESNAEAVGLVKHDGLVTNLAFGLPDRWSQILFAKSDELDLFKAACYDMDTSRWFGHEVINRVIDNHGVFEAKEIKTNKLWEIDNPSDIEIASRIP